MAAARLRVSVASPDAADHSTRGLGAWLARVAPASAKGEVSVAIVSDRRMRSLNRQFRGVDQVTDVLSFTAAREAGDGENRSGLFFRQPSSGVGKIDPIYFLGDIVIAAGVAARQAREAGHSVVTEVRVLTLHGLLHLLGHDHDVDNGRMARIEARLRKKGGLVEGLVERSRRLPSTASRKPTGSRR